MKQRKIVFGILAIIIGMVSIALYFTYLKVLALVISVIGIVFGIMSCVKKYVKLGIIGIVISVIGFSLNIFATGVLLYLEFTKAIQAVKDLI